jgi:hypothetical protein
MVYRLPDTGFVSAPERTETTIERDQMTTLVRNSSVRLLTSPEGMSKGEIGAFILARVRLHISAIQEPEAVTIIRNAITECELDWR